jgi:hypothetical protein
VEQRTKWSAAIGPRRLFARAISRPWSGRTASGDEKPGAEPGETGGVERFETRHDPGGETWEELV